MKRKVCAALLLAALTLMAVCAASAQSRGEEWDARYGQGEVAGDYMGTWTVVDVNSFASLRAYPDTKADRVAKVPKWASVEAYYYDGKWFECVYNGRWGYILREYLTDRPGKYPDYPGNAPADDRYNLDNFGYRSVKTGGRGALVFQKAPRGSFMYDYEYWDGDRIYVNLNWRESGYAIAYSNGTYGYVDASYINWNGGGSGDSSKDLSNFEYRRVNTRGRGALVFQKAPRGSFMYDYEYWDGDRIYVNVNWRRDGYAIAYENGTYGYVDASYISW